MNELKYARFDISNGITSIKVGMSSIIHSILNGIIDSYTLEFPFNIETLISFVYHSIPNVSITLRYSGTKYVYRLSIENKCIEIEKDNFSNNYIFSLIK